MYNTVLEDNDPIRQGDIFRWLPKTQLVYGQESLPYIYKQESTNEIHEIDWFLIAERGEYIDSTVRIIPTTGIVITQDCDAARSDYIAFCEKYNLFFILIKTIIKKQQK